MHKELLWIKGWAQGKGFYNLINAISLADEYHRGQKRAGGEDYIVHPSRVCKMLLNHGIENEDILAAAILHDVLEDTRCDYDTLVNSTNEEIASLVGVLTKNKDITKKVYLSGICSDWRTSIIKLSDRVHNLSTMTKAWSIDKIRNYIRDTEEHIIPVANKGIVNYPKISNLFYSFKLQLEILTENISNLLDKVEEKKENESYVVIVKGYDEPISDACFYTVNSIEEANTLKKLFEDETAGVIIQKAEKR